MRGNQWYTIDENWDIGWESCWIIIELGGLNEPSPLVVLWKDCYIHSFKWKWISHLCGGISTIFFLSLNSHILLWRNIIEFPGGRKKNFTGNFFYFEWIEGILKSSLDAEVSIYCSEKKKIIKKSWNEYLIEWFIESNCGRIFFDFQKDGLEGFGWI